MVELGHFCVEHEIIYNDNFVNFYLNLENNSKNSNTYLIQRESLRT